MGGLPAPLASDSPDFKGNAAASGELGGGRGRARRSLLHSFDAAGGGGGGAFGGLFACFAPPAVIVTTPVEHSP